MICTFKLTPFQSGPRRHRPHPSNITSFSVWEKGKKKKERKKSGNYLWGWPERRLESGPDLLLGILCSLSSVAQCSHHHGDVASFRGHLFAVLQFPAPHHFFRWTRWAWQGSELILIVLPAWGPLLVLILSLYFRPHQISFYLPQLLRGISWGREYLPGRRGFKRRGKLYLRALLTLGFVKIGPLN